MNTPAGAVPVADFVEESYATGLLGITDLEWGANGLLYTAHKNGVVRVVDNGVVLGVALDISDEVNDDAERGLLGIAVHPDLLAGSPYLYAFYAYDPPEAAGQTGLAARDGGGQRVARLTRFTLDDATGYTSVVGGGTTILGAAGTWATAGDPFERAGAASPDWACGTGPYVDDCLPADAGFHGSGNLTFGPDGMLYVGMGDGADFSTESRSLRAIDVTSLAGKVLRIDPETGLGLPSNPYWTGDGNDNASRVLHLGNRNPYRFGFGPGGELWIGDVGSGEFEEVNQGAPGADFGWPCYEGGADGSLQQNPDFAVFAACQTYYASNAAVAPYYAYSHDPGSAAIIAGEIVTNPAWPASMRDGLVIADYVRQTVTVLETDGTPVEVPLATDLLAVDMTFGPDGHLYLANVHNGSVVRIRFSPGEQPPGMLRVTSSPPVPTVISADGLDRSSWGLDWLEVQPGTYEVCFDDVPGFQTPACRDVAVSSGLTGISVGDFAAQGNLVVSATMNGIGAPVAGVISIDGQPAGVGGVSTFRDPGLHEICWGPVVDLAPPACRIVDLLPGQVLPVSGGYDPSPGQPGPGPHGFLRTVSNPAVPTTVLVDGVPAAQWSTEWIPHAPGTYEICFTDVPGYLTPACQSVAVVDGATTTVAADFVRMGTLRATTSPPVNVVISVDGIPRNNWGLLTTMAPGTYTVCAEYPDQVCDQAVIVGGVETPVELARVGGPTNQPPVAAAGGDQSLVDADGSGDEPVSLDASGSSDPDGSIVSYLWTVDGNLVASGPAPTVSLPVGTTSVTLSVTDDDGAVGEDAVEITVQPRPNQSPTAVAGPDQSVEDSDDSGAETITLDGSGSSDPDGVIASYEWREGGILIGSGVAPSIAFAVGVHTVELTVTDDDGASATDLVQVTVSPAPDPVISLYLTADGDDTVGGVAFDAGDVIARNQDTGAWSMVLDMSDVGLDRENLTSIHRLDDGSWVLGFDATVNVADVGDVPTHDLVRFVPTSTGSTTAGSFERYFDGSDVGLSTGAESIDALAVLANGDLVISTTGNGSVGSVSFNDEDLIRFTPSSLGAATSGSWTLHLDGSQVGLTQSGEDIVGVGVTSDGSLHFSALQNWAVPGASGDESDVFTCASPVPAPGSSCNYSLFFDGSANGLSVSVDGVFIGED